MQQPSIFIVRVSPDPASCGSLRISARAVDQERAQVFRSIGDFGRFLVAAAAPSGAVACRSVGGSKA